MPSIDTFEDIFKSFDIASSLIGYGFLTVMSTAHGLIIYLVFSSSLRLDTVYPV